MAIRVLAKAQVAEDICLFSAARPCRDFERAG